MLISSLKGSKYKHFYLLFLFIFLLLWFKYLKMTIIPKHIIYCRLDSMIPFVKEFILAYYFWFIYMALGFLYLGFVSKKDFYKLYIFIFLSMSIAYIIFMIFPNGQFPRPIITHKDLFSRMVSFIYSIDETNNVCPSLHVSNAIGVHLALINCDRLKDKLQVKAASFIIMILICLSTVFVKQHSVIDVAAGILLASVIYLLIYQIPKLIFGEISQKEYAN